jgi:hypothetical protein
MLFWMVSVIESEPEGAERYVLCKHHYTNFRHPLKSKQNLIIPVTAL